MDQFDPTVPLYQQAALTKEKDEIDKLIDEVFLVVKLTNPKALIRWTEEDISEAGKAIRRVHLEIGGLRQALQRFKSFSKTKMVDFGEYYRIANQIKTLNNALNPVPLKMASNPNDWRDRQINSNATHQCKCREAPKGDSQLIAKYWMRSIKVELAQAGGVTSKLPYDKNSRATKC